MTEEWAAAFLAAQKEFPTIGKNKTANIPTQSGGSYSYSYADLGDVLEAVLPILHKHGLALSQPPITEDGRVGVEVRLTHESGHTEALGRLLLPSGNTPQTAGSALTYARRYAACAALGVVADEDDDGAAASRPVREDPQVDGSEWLANAVQQFKEWTEEERRTNAAQIVQAEGYGKPITLNEAKAVIDAMDVIYREAFPPTDEAPF